MLYLLSLGAKNAFFPLKTAAFFTLSSCNIGVLLLWPEQTSFVDLFFIELEIISAYFFIQWQILKKLCEQFLGKLFHHCVSTNTLHHYKYCDDSYILWLTLSKFLRAGSGQSPTRNLARGPWILSGPTQPGPHFWRPVVARGNIFLARMARI